MKVMVDTNVIISAVLFPGSIPAQAFEKVLKDHRLVLCSQIIEELLAIFEKKFSNKLAGLKLFIANLSYEMVDTPTNIARDDYPDIRDEADLPILAAAINANVNVFISGDKDFLSIQDGENRSALTILSPKEFVEKF